MLQSRVESLIESLMNTVIGYSIALLVQIVIFPLYDINVPLTTNIWLVSWFTIFSIIRSYVVRRWFNASSINVEIYIVSNCSRPFTQYYENIKCQLNPTINPQSHDT